MMNIAGKAENTLVKVESDFFHNFIVELVAFLRTGEIHVPHDQTLAIMAVRGAGPRGHSKARRMGGCTGDLLIRNLRKGLTT